MIVRSRSEKAEKMRRELDAATLDIHQKQARIRMLEDLEKNMEGYSGSVKAVMREAKRGTLRGIHGPVSQLITVDAKYAAAVETALGAAVQNIVTDDESAAKRAIAYLKESRAGRATFLPMTAIKPRPFREDGLDSCVGFIDMADRLLRCDDEYLPIIRNLLSHTAVADNIDSAIAISKRFGHRFKVVTLDGQVMNAGGSMTGGSRGQNAGILSRGNDIEQLKRPSRSLKRPCRAAGEIQRARGRSLGGAGGIRRRDSGAPESAGRKNPPRGRTAHDRRQDRNRRVGAQ